MIKLSPGRVIAAVVGVLALLAVAAVAWRARRPPPNVLIVLWDTVRADRLSMYGYARPTTPRMAAWAEEYGVVYENALSPAMWTVPSHASMFTGLAPTTHGAGTDHRWLDGHRTTLAEHFAAHGYHTYAFSSNPNLSKRRVNLVQGFEVFEAAWSPRWRRKVVRHTKRKLLDQDESTEISPGRPDHNRHPGYNNAGPITRRAFLDFLDRREARSDERPFFAYLSYMEAHKPRVPSLIARRQVVDDPQVMRRGLQTDLTFKSQLLYSYGLKDYTEEELEAVNRVYDATLIDLDETTGGLLADLEERGVLDDTIVVFTSDHGEQLGEHQQFGHRSEVYQQLLHVPLVIAYPGALEPGRVSTRVTNLDLFSTLIELAGLPHPRGEHKRGNLARVRDLVAQTLFAESISIDRLGFAKVRKLHPELERDRFANLYRAVVGADHHKLIQTVDYDSHEVVEVELYDLEVDPFEEHDLSEDRPASVEELTQQLEAIRAELPKWDPGEADNAAAEAQAKEMTPEMCRQLEGLGYIEEGCEEFVEE